MLRTSTTTRFRLARRIPDLHLEVVGVYPGMVNEVLVFDPDGLATSGYGTYPDDVGDRWRAATGYARRSWPSS